MIKKTILSLLAAVACTSIHAMSIQELINQARPGDVIEVPGGVYYETLSFPRGGEPGKPITLRAKSGEIAVINAGKKLEGSLTAVKGLPEVYVAKVADGVVGDDSGLWEVSSRLRLVRTGSLEECSRRLASWYYDKEKGELYIRSSGFQPADRLEFWFESADKPAILVQQSHIIIEGLHITLGEHGVFVKGRGRAPDPQHVVIRNNRVYCNKKAGIHVSGTNLEVLGNEVFYNNHLGIQLRFMVEHSKVVNNFCYANGPANGEGTDVPEPVDLSLYSRAAYNLIADNIMDGFTKNAYRNKYGVNQTDVFTRNVIRGNANPAGPAVVGNTFLVSVLGPREGMYLKPGSPSSGGTWDKVDPHGMQRATNLIHPLMHEEDPRFADPVWYDFRLQSDSPYRGLGAHPGFASVFYVNPESGDDNSLGMSIATAFASLKPVFGEVSGGLEDVATAKNSSKGLAPAGSTVYLMDGNYREPVVVLIGGLEWLGPMRVRAYGKSPHVKIQAPWRIEGDIDVAQQLNVTPGANRVVLEGLHFENVSLLIHNARNIEIRNCVFEGGELILQKSQRVIVDHNTFVGGGVRIEESAEVSVTQNLANHEKWLNSDDSSKVYEAWNVAHKGVVFANHFTLPANAAESTAAADFGFVGARGEARESRLHLEDVKVTGISTHGATLQWKSPRQTSFAEVTVKNLSTGETVDVSPKLEFEIMGEYFDMSFLPEAFFGTERYASLGRLQPATEYEVTLTPTDFLGFRGATQTVRFATLEKPAAPRTWYVGPNGDDSAAGSSPDKAWKTFHRAFEEAGPGDTILLLPGEYHETLRPRVSGTAEAPIIIKSQERRKAVIGMKDTLKLGVEILNVDHIQVDGLLLGKVGRGRGFLISRARGIQIRNCEMDWPTGSNFVNLKGSGNGLTADNAPDLLIEDNLIMCNIIGIGVSSSPGAIIRHNTILGSGNYGVALVPGGADEHYQVIGNIFERVIMGYKTGPNIWMFDPEASLDSDYNLFYFPEEHKATIGKLPSTERFRTLKEWQDATGLDLHSVFGSPKFVDPENCDFRLLPDSPGKGAMPDGSDIGKRW